MGNINNTLIRLMDCDEYMITAFYTENGSDFLKQYQFCKINEISIVLPCYLKEPNKYSNCISGYIDDIVVRFGGNESVPSIDVLLADIY